MRALRQLFDRELRSASQRAKAFLESNDSDCTTRGTSLRAAEESRYVFAVFYTRPNLMIKPCPYKLVAVDRYSENVELLDPPRESKYWIRGRK